jgi:hypothetical protein
MSDWQIEVVYRGRDDSIAEVFEAAGELEGEAAAVARQVALGAVSRGITNAGDLMDEIEAATPAIRRELLNEARQAAGLDTVEGEEWTRAQSARRVRSSGRDAQGRIEALCAEPECRNA